MSYFQKENTALSKIDQEIYPTSMLEYLVILYIIGSWCIDGRYRQYYMSVFLIINWTIEWWKFLTFMIALMGVFLSRLVFIGAGK